MNEDTHYKVFKLLETTPEISPRELAKANMSVRFLTRKMAEYEALKVEIEELKAELSGVSECRR